MNLITAGAWVVALVALGEYLGLGQERNADAKEQLRTPKTARSTFFVLRLLNYVFFFAFIWSTTSVFNEYRSAARSEVQAGMSSEYGNAGPLAKVVWTLCLIYFFGFFGVTFVDKESQNDSFVPSTKPKSMLSLSSVAAVFKQILVDLWCTTAITHLCVNVAFDLFFLLPLLYPIRLVSVRLFKRATTFLINWTTPIVIGPAMSWSRLKVMTNELKYFEDSKIGGNMLCLSNHGSRIDWLVGMFVGYCNNNIRVNFVCEWLVRYLPLIGWYRDWVCEDIFVNRSFKSDKEKIVRKIKEYKGQKLMFFLAPEGAVVDHDELGRGYIAACRKFCTEQGYEPFEYCLTPRYKGLTCLAEHVVEGGEIISVLMGFTRDGKLMNEKLTSPDRVVPDLYSTFAGAVSAPTTVNIYIYKIPTFSPEDGDKIKGIMMKDYKRKDECLKSLHEKGHFPGVPYEKMIHFKCPHVHMNIMIFLHNASWILSAYYTNTLPLVLKIIAGIFIVLTISQNTGRLLENGTMEAIPFETGIKAILMGIYKRKMKKRAAKAKAAGKESDGAEQQVY